MVTIRDFKPSDAEQIFQIIDEQLGKNYVSLQNLNEFSVIVACVDEICVSVCIFYLEKNGVGVVKTIATDENFKRNGIATKLIDVAVQRLILQGVTRIISPLWKVVNKINSESVFRANGFVPVREIENFWYEDSFEKGYLCPICGNPCKCTCVVFEKLIDSQFVC